MKKVCVYCSARDSISPMIIEEAKRLGESFHQNQFELVYGGAESGAMGAVAKTLLSLGGKVSGIFPKDDLKHEKPLEDLKDLVFVDDMWTRKKRMVEESDGFVVFPGGTGTLDEFFEVLVMRQLSDATKESSIMYNKPIVILNLFGFWDPMLEMMQIYSNQGFIDQTVHEHYHVVESVEEAMATLKKTWKL